MYIADIEEAVSRIAAAPFNPESFPFDFIAAYDAPPATVTRIRNGTQNASDIGGGVLWRQKLHMLVCARGEVEAALEQLAASRATTSQRVQFLVATDGNEFAARDIKADDAIFCAFDEAGDRFGFFLPLAGYARYKAAEENPIDVKAANKLSRLYDALIAENPEWASDDMRHAMNLFMTRVIFCLFAEDTGILPEENQFSRAVHENGGHAGEEMVRTLTLLFTAMNTRDAERGELPKWAADFPWVNGGLFAGEIQVPRFTRTAYRTLCDAARLRWNEINADIFGSMIQVIVDPAHRHETGMHYTSVPNILKALDPLFLDELRAEALRHPLADTSREKTRLKALLNRLSKIRVFDPACGSGNFLVIAYQELRKIERDVLERLRALTGHAPGIWSHIELHNFYGIEISDFAAETAKLSLWIAKYQMDRTHRDLFGSAPPALPLTDSGNVVCGDALQRDWLEICPPPTIARNRQKVFDLATIVDVQGKETVPDEEVETYIVGNPPYLGARLMNAEQKSDLGAIVSVVGTSWRVLDYVTGWFVKAADYIRQVERSSSALVATNSICQGQQVPVLWPWLLRQGAKISFAHTSFKWSNNATGAAAVMCVIVGLSRNTVQHSLFSGSVRQDVAAINPYLAAGPTLYIEAQRRPINGLPPMLFGNMPRDDGGLILSQEEKDLLLRENPETERWIKPFIGAREAISGLTRYCLWISDAERQAAEGVPFIQSRFERVRIAREESDAASTRAAAAFPHRFVQIQGVSNESTIIVPKVSSENRRYLPVDFLTGGEIISDNAFALYDAPLWLFSLLSSRLHLLWIEAVCGKLETRFRYSNTMGWHTFPVPAFSAPDRERLTVCAENILIARAEVGGTLAQQYDRDGMPATLQEAHDINDQALERIYSDRPFRSDADRVNHLFRRYARMIATERGEEVAPEFDLIGEGQSA